jgi:hypothetical protein
MSSRGREEGWEVGGITKGSVFVSASTVGPKTVIIPEREPAVRDSWIVRYYGGEEDTYLSV